MKNELKTGFEDYRDKSCRQMDPLFLAVQQLIVLWSTPSRPSLHCSCYSGHHCNNLDGCFYFKFYWRGLRVWNFSLIQQRKALSQFIQAALDDIRMCVCLSMKIKRKLCFCFQQLLDIRIKLVMISWQNKTRTKRYSSMQ